MLTSIRLRSVLTGLIVATAAGLGRAEEPASSFLTALRENAYYDAALMYLDQMEQDALAPAAFRTRIAYERGVTLVLAASVERSLPIREQLLNDAQVALDEFIRTRSDDPLVPLARRQFGNLLYERARLKVEQADGSEREKMLADAKGLYDQAYKIFTDSRDRAREELAEIPKSLDANKDRELLERREDLRKEYLQAMLLAAAVTEEKADTVADKSPERKKILESASSQYNELFTKYGKYLAGLYARMYSGRVQMKLGEFDTALTYFKEDLLNQESDPLPFRQLKTKTLLLAMDCWLDDQVEKFDEAVEFGTNWLEQMRSSESSEPDWISLRLKLAQAHKRYADQLKAKNPRDKQARLSYDEAKKLARAVARIPSEYQESARVMLAELPGGLGKTSTAEKKVAETFEEARVAGREALTAKQNAEYVLDSLQQRLVKEKDAKVQEELKGSIEEAKSTAEASRVEALANLQLAMQLASSETPHEDLNLVRYYLAYLYFEQEDYYDAAVLGEFLARRFPGSSSAVPAAEVALAAYLKLFEDAGAEHTFESDHIISLGDYVVETWSGQPVAASATATLVPFLIKRGEVDRARGYVDRIPEASADRGAAELRIGQAMWKDFKDGIDQVEEWEAQAKQPNADATQLNQRIADARQELEQLKAGSLNMLESGIERVKNAADVDVTVPIAVLTLVEIYRDLNQADKAMLLLDDQKIGPLAMIERGDPVMQDSRLKEETYKLALTAILARLSKVSGAEQREKLVDRARQMVGKLREHVGDTPEGQSRLVRIFFSMARGLEDQIKLLDNPKERQVLSAGFDAFLDEVRSQAKEISFLNWVAESYIGLGDGLAGDGSANGPAAQYYRKAVETYDQILATAKTQDLSAEAVQQLTVRKANALRHVGEYEQAIKIYTQVLLKEERRLDIQVEAARTYQAWAEAKGQSKRYANATLGGQIRKSTRKPVIWGWKKIASVTSRLLDQYSDTFFDAQYNAAYCYYKRAMREKNAARTKTLLGYAKRDITLTKKLYPDMGGPKWRDRFNRLMKDVQRALKEKPVGLAAVK